jgi:quercetin dioxygenase-like cupin family protein
MKTLTLLTSAALIASFGIVSTHAQTTDQATHQQHGADHRLYTPDAIRWTAAPPSFRRGAEAALLYGDPSKEGPFVLRLKFPDGYVIAPHRHAGAEILTVLSGTFALGAGEDANRGEVTRMQAGSFTAMPAGMPHYARAEGETVVQLNSVGPWSITYINPSDDPRRQ